MRDTSKSADGQGSTANDTTADGAQPHQSPMVSTGPFSKSLASGYHESLATGLADVRLEASEIAWGPAAISHIRSLGQS